MTGQLLHAVRGSLPEDDPHRRAVVRLDDGIGRSCIATSAASAPGSSPSRESSTPTSPPGSAGSRSRRRSPRAAWPKRSQDGGRPSRPRSSTSADWPESGTSTPTRRSGARRSTRSGPPASSRTRARRASPRHPRCAPSRDRASGSDAPRLPHARRRQRRHAARVQGLRPRGRAVRALRHADREDPGAAGRGTWYCPTLPAAA